MRSVHFIHTSLRSAIVCVAVAWGCGGAPSPDTELEYVTVGIGAAPDDFDPRLGADEGSQRVSQLVYSTLMAMDDHLRVVPNLAARLERPNPLTYVAYLRSGVRFHDGHELMAQDVVYTFGSLLDPGFVSPRKGAYRLLESVEAMDDHTVVFRLKEPFDAFPVQLVMPVVPAGVGNSLRTFPIGTGPYRFVRSAADDRVVLSAFEGYWDGLPQNAGVVLKVIPDETTRDRELRQGTVDLIVNGVSSAVARRLEQDGLQLLRAPGVDQGTINIAVMQRGITGLRLSPRADFLALKDVRKGGAADRFSS